MLLSVAVLAAAFFFQTDEAAVRGVVEKYVDARERGDESAVRGLFTKDADQLVSTGEWRKGREPLVKGTLASSRQNTGRRTITLESVRFVAPGVAVADGRYEIGDRKMWTTFVIVKEGGWKIAAIRNMLPAASR